MAGNVRLKLNRSGVVKLLQSQAVLDDLTERGERIAAAAGEGVEVRPAMNRDRVVVFVATASYEARRAEADDGALTRAIDAGR